LKSATWKTPYEYVGIVYKTVMTGAPTVMIVTMDDVQGLVTQPLEQFARDPVLRRAAYRSFLGHPKRLLEGLQKHLTRPCAATSDKGIAHILGCEYRVDLQTAGTAVTNLEFAALVLDDARVVFDKKQKDRRVGWAVDQTLKQFRVDAPPILVQQIFDMLGVFRDSHIQDDDANVAASGGQWQILRIEHFLQQSPDFAPDMAIFPVPQWTREQRDQAVRRRFAKDSPVASKFMGSFFAKTVAEQWLYQRVGEDITITDAARRTQTARQQSIATDYVNHSLQMIHQLINDDAYYPSQDEMLQLQSEALTMKHALNLEDSQMDLSVMLSLPKNRILPASSSSSDV
jgi:hypothetical protein